MASMSKGLVRRGDHGCCVDPACRHFGPRRSGDCYLWVAATSEWSHACGWDTGTEVKDRQVGRQARLCKCAGQRDILSRPRCSFADSSSSSSVVV